MTIRAPTSWSAATLTVVDETATVALPVSRPSPNETPNVPATEASSPASDSARAGKSVLQVSGAASAPGRPRRRRG